MVLGSYPKTKYPGLKILDIADVFNHRLWSETLDKDIAKEANGKGVVLYGSRDSFCRNYKGKFPVVELAEAKSPSATDFREATVADMLQDENFRRGWIAACFNRYPMNFPTVDAFILNEDKTKVLLCRKYNDPDNKYRTPGGFFDRTLDKSNEEAVVRETQEETGLIGVSKPVYLGSTPIDDPRYAGEPDGILTTAFVIEKTIGEPKASDDLNGLRWFTIKELLEKDGDQFIEYHKPLWTMFKENYLKVSK